MKIKTSSVPLSFPIKTKAAVSTAFCALDGVHTLVGIINRVAVIGLDSSLVIPEKLQCHF